MNYLHQGARIDPERIIGTGVSRRRIAQEKRPMAPKWQDQPAPLAGRQCLPSAVGRLPLDRLELLTHPPHFRL